MPVCYKSHIGRMKTHPHLIQERGTVFEMKGKVGTMPHEGGVISGRYRNRSKDLKRKLEFV